MDYKNPIYTKYENNQPDAITNLVIEDEKVNEYDIFGLKDNPIPVFITLALKLNLKK